MRPGVDLNLRRVSKRYLVAQPGDSGSHWLARLRSPWEPRREFWAVEDVSFAVEHGESLGIIGHNGAGKSTLLKMLSGITAPTRGEIAIRGRLSALLEVGSGFHPELTGRENIYLSGSVLGMPRHEIHRKLDSIIDFAGIDRFIDTPVKRYSSGMFVRLGFSIAAHLEPEVLLLDEVLAVGDRTFQEKCKDRIGQLHREGTTLVFISHDLAAVQTLCQRVLLLERGRIAAEGTPEEVICRYTETNNLDASPADDAASKRVRITRVGFFDAQGNRSAGFRTGFPIRGRVEYLATEHLRGVALSLHFIAPDASIAAQWTTARDSERFVIRPGQHVIEFSSKELGLLPGVYKIDAHVEELASKRLLDHHPRCTSIYVRGGKQVRGAFYIPHRWHEIPTA
jgi:lipopolysaccharide transport system ATP-binding protein